jgi:hypothetical protein
MCQLDFAFWWLFLAFARVHRMRECGKSQEPVLAAKCSLTSETGTTLNKPGHIEFLKMGGKKGDYGG